MDTIQCTILRPQSLILFYQPGFASESLIDSRLTSLAHLKKLHLYVGSTSSRNRADLPLS
jgi:hypothetical protein